MLLAGVVGIVLLGSLMTSSDAYWCYDCRNCANVTNFDTMANCSSYDNHSCVVWNYTASAMIDRTCGVQRLEGCRMTTSLGLQIQVCSCNADFCNGPPRPSTVRTVPTTLTPMNKSNGTTVTPNRSNGTNVDTRYTAEPLDSAAAGRRVFASYAGVIVFLWINFDTFC